MDGKKKNHLNRLKSAILNDLQSLENDAMKLNEVDEGDDIDQVFQMLRLRLEERYRVLKENQSERTSFTAIVRDLDRLKREAMCDSASKLKEVHKEVNELKTAVLFASPPPKINTEDILSAIDSIGQESDSEDTDEIVQPLNDTSPQEADNHISPPRSFEEPAVPFTSYSTHSHRQPRSTKNTSESERPPQISADFGRAPTRHASQERQDEFDTRSFSSHQSSKKPKQADLLSPKDLLGPGAFTSAQPKTIELTDTSLTPDRKPQPRLEDSRRSMEHSRTPVREPVTPVYQPPMNEAAVPPPGKGPEIQDLCRNTKIKRYFTESSQYSNPDVDSWCTIEELYNPTQFFVLPENIEEKRDRVQIEVYNYIGTNITTLQAVKSLPIGKMVLCQFDDGQWYRACIVKTLKDHHYSILFVDYGNYSERVKYDRLRAMPDYILEMEPMCVQQCYLAGIMPPDRGPEWDPSTVEALWDLVSGKTLKITVQDVTNQVYGVVLELPEGSVLVDINNKLVELELAIRHQVESAEPMKELCSSPTRFAPPSSFPSTKPAASAFHSTKSASPTYQTAKTTQRKTRNRSSPPSTRRPYEDPPPARIPSGSHAAPPSRAPLQQPASVHHDTTTPRHRAPSSSDDSGDYSLSPPSVGRPPSFGSAQQPASRPINSLSFGDTSAKGRGNVFGNAPSSGSFPKRFG